MPTRRGGRVKPDAPNPKPDPDNRLTVVLERWPEESEKTREYRDAVTKIRSRV